LTWLDEILEANKKFREEVDVSKLPKQPIPGSRTLITCMDPRVRPEATGVKPLAGERLILLAGGIPEMRSLVVSVYLTGTKEIAIMFHTDCGMTRIYKNLEGFIGKIQQRAGDKKFREIKAFIGEPFKEKLLNWIGGYEDPRQHVKRIVETVKNHPLMPEDLVVHGLVYNINTGEVEVVVDGYKQ
jgi:carbonic anhydrase